MNDAARLLGRSRVCLAIVIARLLVSGVTAFLLARGRLGLPLPWHPARVDRLARPRP